MVSVVAVPSVKGKQLPNLSRGGTPDSGAVEQPFAGQHSKTASLGSESGSDTEDRRIGFRHGEDLGDVSTGYE